MLAINIVFALVLSTITFWVLAIYLPLQAALFLLLYNISFGILIFYGGILLGMLIMMFVQWRTIEYEPLHKEKYELTLTDGVKIHGEILTADHTDDTSPVVIACHGYLGSMKQLYMYAFPLVVQGYKVVMYNHRGHGKKPFKSGGNRTAVPKIFMDVQQVIDFVESRPDLNHERLAAMGGSLGGGTVLTGGYTDPRIKLVIALDAGHDFVEGLQRWTWYIRLFFRLTGLKLHFSEEINRKMSPKYFLQQKLDKVVCLIHAKNDRVVSYDAFLKNKELLNLPDEKTLSFERGDHALAGQYTMITSQIIKWLDTYL